MKAAADAARLSWVPALIFSAANRMLAIVNKATKSAAPNLIDSLKSTKVWKQKIVAAPSTTEMINKNRPKWTVTRFLPKRDLAIATSF
jgi:hypothetical protein